LAKFGPGVPSALMMCSDKRFNTLSLLFFGAFGEKVIEAAILADDDDVFDRGRSFDRIDRSIRVVCGSGWCAKAKNRHCERQREGSNFLTRLSCLAGTDSLLQGEDSFVDECCRARRRLLKHPKERFATHAGKRFRSLKVTERPTHRPSTIT